MYKKKENIFIYILKYSQILTAVYILCSVTFIYKYIYRYIRIYIHACIHMFILYSMRVLKAKATLTR